MVTSLQWYEDCRRYGPSFRTITTYLSLQVMSKELKEQGYYKEKGVVEKVVSKYLGQIAMLKSGDVLQVMHCSLQTYFLSFLAYIQPQSFRDG